MSMSFADLGVPARLVQSLDKAGISAPFPVQTATLPDAISGRDLLARARTGSGKTLAFGLGMLVQLENHPTTPLQPQGLILVPTRELAMQVSDSLRPHAEAAGVRMRLVAGGMPYAKQIEAIRRGTNIVIATPGRLTDLVNKGAVDLSRVRITVLDEADQMCDMGFLPQVREILDLTRPGSQRMLFSATLNGDVDGIVRRYMTDPVRHELAPEHAPVESMEHHIMLVHPADRSEVLARIASRQGRTIFFARTQAGVDRITAQLNAEGVAAGGLHGGKTQAVRTRTLQNLHDGVTTALVATDVAARGIHVDGITLVVQVDPPAGPKDYLHRAGRTARAGESGTVVTLAHPKSRRQVERLTSQAGVTPQVTRVRPADEALADVTGARQPSGVPWTEPQPKRSERGAERGSWRGPKRSDRGPKRGPARGSAPRGQKSVSGSGGRPTRRG
ncbi:MAG: DEAD/DEAH box helicase [Actinomycetales bacterium]|nr:DEAD/DEAH box helicase [Actinomycetales bacterium]